MSDEQHAKLSPLVEPRAKTLKTQLGAFVASQLSAQASELEPSSQIVYGNVEANLLAYFGKTRDIATITPQDARDFRHWLETEANRNDDGALAANTVRKRTGVCKTLFAAAVDEGLINRNPFAKLPSTVRPNADREYYLEIADFRKLLKVVKDPDWRALLMLARLEALRIPSEAATLEWSHIDFDKKQILIYATKTKKKKPVRIAPLLPELEKQLESIERKGAKVFPWLTKETNLRQQLERYIKRAGLTQWPKLWQNLRTSAATDFARAVPAHVAAKVCGHTVQIARAYYWQVTDSDIADARERIGGHVGGHVGLQSGAVRCKVPGKKKTAKSKKKPEK